MSEVAITMTMAKLAGIKKALISTINEKSAFCASASGATVATTRTEYPTDSVQHYFQQAASHLETLKHLLPDLFGDFQAIETEPELVASTRLPTKPHSPQDVARDRFSRVQAERLLRDIDQMFEICMVSKLEHAKPKEVGRPFSDPREGGGLNGRDVPRTTAFRRVFISHGHADDWLKVQAYIEKDVKLDTRELAQEANMGNTIIEKLFDNARLCDSAVIVMTGDDVAHENVAKVRENVMHEIGFFQGSYGRGHVILLHEAGVSIPTNLGGVAFIPYPKGSITSIFYLLQRELKAIYSL